MKCKNGMAPVLLMPGNEGQRTIVSCRLAVFYLVSIVIGGFSSIFGVYIQAKPGVQHTNYAQRMLLHFWTEREAKQDGDGSSSVPRGFQSPLGLIHEPQIIEGIITIVLGILTWLFVADFPDKNTFLTDDQTKVSGPNSDFGVPHSILPPDDPCACRS